MRLLQWNKAAHPDYGVKRITQIFRRFLGLPVKTHEVRAVLQAHPSSSTAITSRTKRSSAPMRFFERRSPHWDGILGFWRFGNMTNASMEGFNNKGRTMLRQAYGYRDLEYMRLKIFNLPNNNIKIII